MGIFICPNCGNTDLKYIGIRNGEKYCRKCITFKGNTVKKVDHYPKRASVILSYNLSKDQKYLSDKILENYKEGKDTLINAVCGSGKTEIVLGVINYAIRCGDKVAFCIPRRDVVIEIHDRLKQIFKWNSVTAVYGGHTDRLDADIVCLTTHQLYKYPNHFNLIILDEIDAFPFQGNDLLETFLDRSSIGNIVMMSATPPSSVVERFKQKGEILYLNKRFHRHLLPVPDLIIKKTPSNYIFLLLYLKRYLKETKQVFIFAPTIKICERIYKLISIFVKGGNYVHSKRVNRPQIIEKFKKGKYRYLVTTAVLERGVTVKDLQVIVFNANHKLFKESMLVQIAGRAGRKKEAPEGEVIFIADKKNKEITRAINRIKSSNKDLQNMF